MSDQDIFNDKTDQSKTETVATQTSTDVFADKLARIVNDEGKPKYTSVETALDALAASQEHIKRLEQEARERGELVQSLEDQAKKVNSLEEVVLRMTQNKEPSEPARQAVTEGLNEQQIIELVQKALDTEKQTTAAISNVQSVQNQLVSKFGETTSEVIKAKAAELGTTPQKLKTLAAENPNLVLALFGTGKPNEHSQTSTIRTPGLTPQDQGLKAPEKSLISGPGANDRNLRDFMKQVKEDVYKKNGVVG